MTKILVFVLFLLMVATSACSLQSSSLTNSNSEENKAPDGNNSNGSGGTDQPALLEDFIDVISESSIGTITVNGGSLLDIPLPLYSYSQEHKILLLANNQINAADNSLQTDTLTFYFATYNDSYSLYEEDTCHEQKITDAAGDLAEHYRNYGENGVRQFLNAFFNQQNYAIFNGNLLTF